MFAVTNGMSASNTTAADTPEGSDSIPVHTELFMPEAWFGLSTKRQASPSTDARTASASCPSTTTTGSSRAPSAASTAACTTLRPPRSNSSLLRPMRDEEPAASTTPAIGPDRSDRMDGCVGAAGTPSSSRRFAPRPRQDTPRPDRFSRCLALALGQRRAGRSELDRGLGVKKSNPFAIQSLQQSVRFFASDDHHDLLRLLGKFDEMHRVHAAMVAEPLGSGDQRRTPQSHLLCDVNQPVADGFAVVAMVLHRKKADLIAVHVHLRHAQEDCSAARSNYIAPRLLTRCRARSCRV